MSEKESAKPIAYRFKNNRGNGRFEYDYYDADEVSSAYRDNCIEITPLYTAPQSAAALRSQVAALREALVSMRSWLLFYGAMRNRVAAQDIPKADQALTDTEAAAQAWERELRNRVLEEAAKIVDERASQSIRHEITLEECAAAIRAMKQETP